VAQAYGQDARGPLGIYNLAGDLGKAALPAALSLLLTLMPWRQALGVLAGAGALAALGLALSSSLARDAKPGTARDPARAGARRCRGARTGFGC
jgi:hypothetical protein